MGRGVGGELTHLRLQPYYMDVKLTRSPIQNSNADVTPSETMLVSADSLSYCLSVTSNCSFFI